MTIGSTHSTCIIKRYCSVMASLIHFFSLWHDYLFFLANFDKFVGQKIRYGVFFTLHIFYNIKCFVTLLTIDPSVRLFTNTYLFILTHSNTQTELSTPQQQSPHEATGTTSPVFLFLLCGHYLASPEVGCYCMSDITVWLSLLSDDQCRNLSESMVQCNQFFRTTFWLVFLCRCNKNLHFMHICLKLLLLSKIIILKCCLKLNVVGFYYYEMKWKPAVSFYYISSILCLDIFLLLGYPFVVAA